MHDHERKPGHIPPPDMPLHRTYFGFRPHIWVGGLVLIAILFLYLILFINGRPTVSRPQPSLQQSPTSNAPAAAR